MARFLICTMPMTGHINPAYLIARTLVGRGHEVRWYGGKKFRAKIEATGAQFIPMTNAYDFDDSDYNVAFPGREKLKGFALFKHDLKKIFIEPGIAQTHDIEAILTAYPADILLSDVGFGGARLVWERGGPPFATLSVTFLSIASKDSAPSGLGILPKPGVLGRLRNRTLTTIARFLFRDVDRAVTKDRAKLGLPANNLPIWEQALSPFLYIQPDTEAFEYPRSDLPPFVHFVGPLLPPKPAGFIPPVWWPDLTEGRPVVLVTQGTVATNVNELIIPTIRALADTDVLVVATADPAKLGNLPANVRAEAFIPFTELMPHVSLMITNGGFGGVQTALAHGVPLIGAGTTEDKPEVNNRIAWSGVGLNLKTDTPQPEHIRAAVETILSDSRYRQKALHIQADIARHDPPHEAALLLEQLAAMRQPVLRGALPKTAERI